LGDPPNPRPLHAAPAKIFSGTSRNTNDREPYVFGFLRWRMKATISVDHRVSDGAKAAQFMQALAGFLENPVRVLV